MKTHLCTHDDDSACVWCVGSPFGSPDYCRGFNDCIDAALTASQVLDKSAEANKVLGEKYGQLQQELLTPLLRRFIEGVVGYWTTSNDCLPTQEDAERLLAMITGEKQ